MDLFGYIKNNDNIIEDLNTLDIIILTRLSYLHFEDINISYPMKIGNIIKYTKDLKINRNDNKLVNSLANSNRFKNLTIKRFKHTENKELEEVFTGITISLPNNNILVAFRGTGKNVYDFKEDMNMSFKIIPSCILGVKYLEEEKKYNKVIISGHSKGGHIAMYTGCHASLLTKFKIKQIYNFDGPGFFEVDKKMKKMQNKIINYFPESSIVGRMMHSIGKIIVIKTEKQGIEAHSVYNWKYEEHDLVKGILSNDSDVFHESTVNVLNIISKEKREKFVNYLFSLFLNGEIKSIKELDIAKVKELINNAPHMEKIEKNELLKLFKLFFKVSLPEINPRDKLLKSVKKITDKHSK